MTRRNIVVDDHVQGILATREAFQRLEAIGWWVLAAFAAVMNVGMIRYFINVLFY